MMNLDRRTFMAAIALSAAELAAAPSALAQASPQAPGRPTRRPRRIGYEDVVARASALASADFDAHVPPLPASIAHLDWDAWRQIRFRPEMSFLRGDGSGYTLQLFHLGHLFTRPVTISIVRDTITAPIPYSTSLFDFGHLPVPKDLPINLGFAGFRIHYPLNSPTTSDELISFLGSSYFRFLGRGEKYGLSARALAIGTGRLDGTEEFPFFREFWIDTHDGKPEPLTIYGLLDSPSVAGAYRFDVSPGERTSVEVKATLFARKPIDRLGMAPLTSMYFIGENDRHISDRNKYDEYRPELHDSDGLLIHMASGEWIWRPLKNPQIQELQQFPAKSVKGFGLMQRDRNFSDYQDIELDYQDRPSYWIEPGEDWGDGVVELVELATRDETADNIVCAFLPKESLQPGKSFAYSYRMRALQAGFGLHPLGHVINTFSAPARGLGSQEQAAKYSRRFLIDFAGGDMPYYLHDAKLLEVVATATNAKVLRTFVVPNPALKAIRTMIDVQFEEGKVGVVNAFLRAKSRRLTETWDYAWRFYDL